MLSEKDIELLGDAIVPLYQDLEREVIADIARRVKKTGRLTETAELMAKAMMEAGTSPAKIRSEVMKTLRADDAYKKEVANNTKQYKRDIMHIVRQVEKSAATAGDEIVAKAGDMSFNINLNMWHQAGKTLTKDSEFTKIVRSMQERTQGSLNGITKSLGFKGVNGMISVENAYNRYLDKAIIKMSSGAFSFDRCVDDVVKELARSGLRSIDYASGRSYQLDTAARMCIRTTCHQLSAQISMHNIISTGTDLVQVSAHWGARPSHAEWQGKIYSISGRNRQYESFDVCGYGEVDGLCGVNCRHQFYPFFDGSTPLSYQPEPGEKEYNGKKYSYYDSTQKQRQMERNIRTTKREIEAQKFIGGDTKVLESKLRKQEKEYHSFSKAVGISAKDNRLHVVKGSTDLNKFTYSEQLRKGNTQRKKDSTGIEIIDKSTYNKLIKPVLKNGGIVLRGTTEVESHLIKQGASASTIGDTILFRKNATVSDVIEETYHFNQNRTGLNADKPIVERDILNEIDAKEYLLSVKDKYNIPKSETEQTIKQLNSYREELKRYYDSIR